MKNEMKSPKFETLPNRVKAALKVMDRGPSYETELWLEKPVPALGGKSVLEVLVNDPENGENTVIQYCNAVKGKFF